MFCNLLHLPPLALIALLGLIVLVVVVVVVVVVVGCARLGIDRRACWNGCPGGLLRLLLIGGKWMTRKIPRKCSRFFKISQDGRGGGWGGSTSLEGGGGASDFAAGGNGGGGGTRGAGELGNTPRSNSWTSPRGARRERLRDGLKRKTPNRTKATNSLVTPR